MKKIILSLIVSVSLIACTNQGNKSEATNIKTFKENSKIVQTLFDGYSNNDFSTSTNRYYEVDYLAQQRVFVENYQASSSACQSTGLSISRSFCPGATDGGHPGKGKAILG